MRVAWLEAGHPKPGDPNPDDLALYSPSAYLFLSPLALLDWSRVKWPGLRLQWAGFSWIGSMLHDVGLAAAPGGVYDRSPTNPPAFQLVNASAWFHRLTSNQPVVALLLAAICAAVCLFLWKRGQYCLDLLSDPTAFGAACVLGLVLVAHRYYDAAVLVFVLVWALRDASNWRRSEALISIAGCIQQHQIPAFFAEVSGSGAQSITMC